MIQYYFDPLIAFDLIIWLVLHIILRGQLVILNVIATAVPSCEKEKQRRVDKLCIIPRRRQMFRREDNVYYNTRATV